MGQMRKTNTCVGFAILAVLLSTDSSRAEDDTVSLSEAVERTLQSNHGVLIEKERILQSEGSLETATGQFDWVAFGHLSHERERLPVSTEPQDEETAGSPDGVSSQPPPGTTASPSPILDVLREELSVVSFGVARQFRNGVTIIPSLSTVSLENNTNQLDAINRSDVNLEIVVPLGRGWGTNGTGAQEKAARTNVDTIDGLAGHNIARQVFVTATSFWNALAARRNTELLDDTQKRAEDVVATVKRLIDGGILAPVLLNQATAKLALRQLGLSRARLALFQNAQALAVSMGYDPNEMSSVPLPEGTFPEVLEPQRIESLPREGYIREALKLRRDYQSAGLDLEAREILQKKASNDMRPITDLQFKIGYAGLDGRSSSGRYFYSLFNETRGPNLAAMFNLELPVGNHAARGELVRRTSLVREAELVQSELELRIVSDVTVAIEAVLATVKEDGLASDAVEAYRRSVDDTLRKLKIGEASLYELIDIEDRYFEARVEKIETERRYAVAMTQLRFATGTLIEGEGSRITFSADRISQLPFPKESP